MDVSISPTCAAEMHAEHELNKLREEELSCTSMDTLRKLSEGEVHKLSEDCRRKVTEKRRMSTQGNSDGLPIMQAFQKVS
ncbi:unnamed protein product [Cylicostephanus goldi]|uniref:Uncharacterized protein n=1 Tax=Cylicostephanus goldi TaxID=71465 RepID=A0A3P6RA13_CYLGO|nr:unnamed protein product [Cylicostephanus goldi]